MGLSAFGAGGAPWRGRAGLDALIAALGAGESRIVGGAVRDALLGIEAADLDLATTHPPDEVMRRLAAAGIKAIPTGIAHGTITAPIASGPVEVTTLRRDVSTDGRHALVAFTDDWREDAARRDFTINALYADPATDEVFDYFGGRDDLAAGRVRFIGDPLARIAEDHLRILRYFRFHARFGDRLDAAALAACGSRANDLMALSRERIASELIKLLAIPAAPPTVELMVSHGILAPVLPEIDARGVDRLRTLTLAELEAGVAPHPIRRLAALVPADAAESVGARLKLSKADRRRLTSATGPLDPLGPRALAYRQGVESAIDRLLLRGGSVADVKDWTPPRLPITGGALVARGMSKGPEVAAALRRVEDAWVAEGFPGVTRFQMLADSVLRLR